MGELRRRIEREPYGVIGAAFGTGYVLGDGFFSRTTRPLARAALAWLLGARARRAGAQLERAFLAGPAAGADYTHSPQGGGHETEPAAQLGSR